MASSSWHTNQYKYEVFISFRGEDTRENFTSHLHTGLCRKKIKTFVDEELRRGDDIAPALLDAIEGSKISIIIFSKDYASSKWCLNELVKILECKKRSDQIVLPVFYHVHPSDVRKQTGSFGDSFVEHERKFKEMSEMVQKWRAALVEASYLSGYESMKIRPEAKLVDVIVKDILKKLEHIPVSSDNLKGHVGINSRVLEIKSNLGIGSSNFLILGIWGMGGIGKTTIAEALFNQISSEFDGKCFMANVREKSEQGGGLEHLQIQVLSQLLEETLVVGGPNIPDFIKVRLRRMKVFIVLDDVNKFKQLEYLVGGLDRFGLGSRIIVTSRDKGVLDKYRVDVIYKVNALNDHEAYELFCNYAFRQNHCPQDLLVLSKRIMDYAKGNPLALKVLGSFLHQKSKPDWENALHNIKQISDPDINDVLKISYDELKWEEKNIFLDIACFFKGDDRDHVTSILNDCYPMHYGLNVLVDKSLVTISDNMLEMHDLLQEMAWEIVRKECIKDPGKRSRLWCHKDVCHVLKKNKGTDTIEGIFLDMSKIRDLHLTSEAFAKMPNLRLLKFYMPNHFNDPNMGSKVHLPQGLDYLSDELRYFHWHGYPLKTLPPNFIPDNLVELNLPYSKVEQLWKGEKDAFKLKFIDLHHSQHLTRIPMPSETPNIERVYLLNCIRFLYVPSAIQNFNNLSILRLSGCRSLRCFPNSIHFRSPIEIDLSGCINLAQFPQISGNIIKLDLQETTINEVPTSIERLTNLKLLDLRRCKRLKSLPSSICKLKSLSRLHLSECSNLETFPEISEKMEQLVELSLRCTAIKELPSSIENLVGLTILGLMNCSKLHSLPENIRNVKSLMFIEAKGSVISELPSSITDLNKLERLSFSGCKGLVLPPLLSGLPSLRDLDLSNCDLVEIPQGIGCLSSLEWLDLRGNDFESLPTSIKQLSRLRYLHLRGCNMLQSLPELSPRLEYLEAINCKQLQFLPELPSCVEELDASILETLSECSRGISLPTIDFLFTNCQKLNGKSNNNILADSQLRIQHMAMLSLRLFYLKELYTPHGINICLPGSGIPTWFSNQCSGSSITIQLPWQWCNRNFIGFALCAVIEFEKDSDASGKFFGIDCSYRFETMSLSETNNSIPICSLAYKMSIDSDHVILGFDPFWNVRIPDGERHMAVSLDFVIFYPFIEIKRGHKVKCCGVCPIYAHPNETHPNTFTLKFGSTSEEERTEIVKFHDDFHRKANISGTCGSILRSEEHEKEPIYREHFNTPQHQSSMFSQIFHKRGGLFAFLIFVLLCFILSPIPCWKLAFDH